VTPGGDAPGRLPAKAACAATAWRGDERCGKSRKISLQEILLQEILLQENA